MGGSVTFVAVKAFETAILKISGIKFNFSENNIQNLQIKYSL